MNPDPRALVLGVDGGGSSTVALLADAASGAIRGRGVSGPSNPKSAGLDAARAALQSARAAAFVDAGLDLAPVAAVCVGLAGVDRPDDRAACSPWFADWADRHLLVNDAEPVIAAGTPEGWGLAIIAGTGSIAYGRAPDGSIARAGGWGPLLGDEGSAYGVAVAALRNILQRYDGRVDDPGDDTLREALARALGEPDPGLWALKVYAPGFDRAQIAALAPVVVEAASRGSMIATSILILAGQELASAARAVHRRLTWPEDSDREFPLAFAGGFLLGAPDVRRELLRILHDGSVVARPRAVTDPARGAVLLARRTFRDFAEPRTASP